MNRQEHKYFTNKELNNLNQKLKHNEKQKLKTKPKETVKFHQAKEVV